MIPGNTNAASLPGGNGVGTVNQGTAGTLSFAGTLGDGTKTTQSSYLSGSNQWPFYLSLYSGKGVALGWQVFTNTHQPSDTLEGRLAWIRPSLASGIYPSGFSLPSNEVFATLWTNRTPLLNWSNGVVEFSAGNPPQTLQNPLWINTAGKVFDLAKTNQLSVSIKPANGTWSGAVRDPATGKNLSLSGVLLRDRDLGYGQVLFTNQTRSVYLGPGKE